MIAGRELDTLKASIVERGRPAVAVGTSTKNGSTRVACRSAHAHLVERHIHVQRVVLAGTETRLRPIT